MAKPKVTQRTRETVGLAEVLKEPYGPLYLVNNPALMIIANRIMQSGEKELHESLAKVSSIEEMREVLIKDYLLSLSYQGSLSYESLTAIDNLFDSGISLNDIKEGLALIVSGELSPKDLRGMNDKAVRIAEQDLRKEYITRVKENVANNPFLREDVRKSVMSNIASKILILGLSASLLGAIYTLGINPIVSKTFESRRGELMRPVYEQMIAAMPQEKQTKIEDLIHIGANQSVHEIPYTQLQSIEQANQLYLEADEMPETSGEFGTEVSKEPLDEKISALDAIIQQYPESVEAYKAQYQIYILKSFNQEFYSPEEIVDEMNTLITNYPNTKALSTKELTELVKEYFLIYQSKLQQEEPSYKEAARATTDWIKGLIDQTQGTHASSKMSYILASIYAGQSELIPFVEEDRLSVIALSDKLLEYAGDVSDKEIIDLYMDSANAHPIRASIAHYSIAQFLTKGVDFSVEESYKQLEDPIQVAEHLEESISLASDYAPYMKFWVADAYYKLAIISRNLEQFDYAKTLLTKLVDEFPNDQLVKSQQAPQLLNEINEQIATLEEKEKEEFEQNFDSWFKQTEEEAGIR